MLKLQKNTARYTILQAFSIALLLELKHHAPQCQDNPGGRQNSLRGTFLQAEARGRHKPNDFLEDTYEDP